MKRKLLRQMGAEWRSNIWMALELLIVSVVLFVLADKLYTAAAIRLEPLGFDTSHCYLLDVKQVSEAAPDYVTYADWREETQDLETLLERLTSRPEVEAAALSFNSFPYNWSNSGSTIDIDTFKMGDSHFVRREVQPDFLKVFRVQGANGETPEELAEVLTNERVLLSDNALERTAGIKSLKPLYGKPVMRHDKNDTLTLRTSFIPMRYGDYMSVYNEMSVSAFYRMHPRSYRTANELTVRVHDNMDNDFAEKIMADSDGYLRVGNWYIASVRSFESIRENHGRTHASEVRNTVICAIFLLVNIFLGILGTFWFRTQQRVKEIALRMVSGATRADVFRRILGEGQLLLLLITPVAIVIDWLLTKWELTTWYAGSYFEPLHFFVSVLVAWGLMALMITVGVYFPARRAMGIMPAIALKQD